MPTPRKLPATDALVRMRNDGMMLKEIADLYGVTEGGVWAALNEAGHTTDRHTYKEVLPFDIDPKHKNLQVIEQFRRIVKLQRGGALTDVDRRRLRNWLTAIKEDGVVVNYHPLAPGGPANALSPVKGGFFYVAREESDGDDVVRRTADDPVRLNIDALLAQL